MFLFNVAPFLVICFSFFYCEFVPFVILSSELHGDVNKINTEKENVVVLNSDDCEFQHNSFCSILYTVVNFMILMVSLTFPPLWTI